jgi:hypothetical protein
VAPSRQLAFMLLAHGQLSRGRIGCVQVASCRRRTDSPQEEKAMKLKPIAAILALTLCAAAQARDGADFVQRNANQQNRIARGLGAGDLTVEEASRLERNEALLQREQARALRHGNRLSPAEQARLMDAAREASRDIRRDRHDRDHARRHSRSTARLEAVVRRSANQQERIVRGLRSGELTHREVARLIEGQARIAMTQADIAADGWVTWGEERRVRELQRREGERIFARNHNDRERNRHRGY